MSLHDDGIAEPRCRGFCLGHALGNLVIAPPLIGALSDVLAHRAFASGDFLAQCPGGMAVAGADPALQAACGSASGTGVMQAIGAFAVLFAWGGVHFLLAAPSLERDLDRHYAVPENPG